MLFHDPVRQISFIRQALSQNRKSIGFFIGAGCPLSVRMDRQSEGGGADEPLIRDVAGLTKAIASRLKRVDGKKPTTWDRVVSVVQEDGGDGSNIEVLLSKIRVLSSVAGTGTVRGLRAAELEDLDVRLKGLLKASHIVAWKRATPAERKDPNNGLLLIASIDAVFDRGFISFDSKGKMIVSPLLSANDRDHAGIVGIVGLKKKPNAEQQKFLARHRQWFRKRLKL